MYTLKQEREDSKLYSITLVTDRGNFGILTTDKCVLHQVKLLCKIFSLQNTEYPEGIYVCLLNGKK